MEFKEEIAKYVGHGVEEENLLLGNGSIELIYSDYGDFAARLQGSDSCAILFRVRESGTTGWW